jgi:hypothetical protein
MVAAQLNTLPADGIVINSRAGMLTTKAPTLDNLFRLWQNGIESQIARLSMARMKTVGPEAKQRLINVGKGYVEREPYREAISKLEGDQNIEVEPEQGETLRKLKLMVRRAAREIGQEIDYGVTVQDTLLVWIAQPKQRRRRGRPALA